LVDSFSEGFSHAEFSTEFLRAGADRWDPGPGEGVNKRMRAQRVLVGLRDAGDEDSAKSALALAEALARRAAPSSGFLGGPEAVWWKGTIDALASDGWEYDVNG
jgi:hypothetical protein